VVRFYFQLTTIHSLATQRLAEFLNAFFPECTAAPERFESRG